MRAWGGWVIHRCQNKTPDRKCDQGGEWRHARKCGLRILRFGKSQWVEFLPWTRDSELGEARRICALQAACIGWVESWGCKSSQHRKIVSLSPHVEKPLISKRWIKVSYLNQFHVFGFLYMFMNIMSISHIRLLWVCYKIFKKNANFIFSPYPFSNMLT